MQIDASKDASGQWTGLPHLSARARAVPTCPAQPVLAQRVTPLLHTTHQPGTARAIAAGTPKEKRRKGIHGQCSDDSRTEAWPQRFHRTSGHLAERVASHHL